MRENFRYRQNHNVRLPGPAQLNRSSCDFSIFSASHERTQPEAYLSKDASTDTGSSSSATGSLFRCYADMLLLVFEQEL
jgi:hypothetical protein